LSSEAPVSSRDSLYGLGDTRGGEVAGAWCLTVGAVRDASLAVPVALTLVVGIAALALLRRDSL
jgi:hypothetical protein